MEKNIRNKKKKKFNLLVTAIPFIPVVEEFKVKLKKKILITPF